MTDEVSKGEGEAKKIYRLKPMVAARFCAEASVFLILLALPLVLLVLGKLFALSWTYKIIVATLGLIGLVMLPVYGFITFQVTIAGDELTATSVFQRQTCLISKISGISRRSNFNWIRFVVSYDGGELTFPIWLKNVDDLVAYLRKAMPGGVAGAQKSLFNRLFKQDPISLFFQIGQAVAGLIFTGVVWFFAVSLYQSGTAGISLADEILVCVFALVVSGILLWRTVVIALMPTSILLREDEVAVQTFFFEKKLAWDKVRSVQEPFPLLPEGFMLNTQKGSYLIGNGMDSADELSAAIKERMVRDKKIG